MYRPSDRGQSWTPREHVRLPTRVGPPVDRRTGHALADLTHVLLFLPPTALGVATRPGGRAKTSLTTHQGLAVLAHDRIE